MRARRLVTVAAVAALGLASLGACAKSSPDVAAYVGDTKYSVDRVDGIFDEAQARYAESVRARAAQAGATPSPDQLQWSVGRQDLINLLVGLDLAKRIVAEKQIQVPDRFAPEQLGQGLGVPGTEYAVLAAEWYDHYRALEDSLPPTELTDAAQAEVYEGLVSAGFATAGWSTEKIRTELGDEEFVRRVTTLSAALQEEAERVGVSVNPRYPLLAIPALLEVQQSLRLYSVPYVDNGGPVTDLPTPEASAPPAGA